MYYDIKKSSDTLRECSICHESFDSEPYIEMGDGYKGESKIIICLVCLGKMSKEVAMPKLQYTTECEVRTGPTSKPKRYRVTFIWLSFGDVLKSAAQTETIKFQAAMRGTVKMPSCVCSYEEIEGA